jgi:hypothetical protein
VLGVSIGGSLERLMLYALYESAFGWNVALDNGKCIRLLSWKLCSSEVARKYIKS